LGKCKCVSKNFKLGKGKGINDLQNFQSKLKSRQMMNIYLVHKVRVKVNILSFISYIPCKYKKLNVREKYGTLENEYLPTINIANMNT